MKKLQVLLVALIISSLSVAQNPSYQQKLFYTCKVWGFVKYFHSNVSTCGVNWDSVLLHCLPLVKSAVTQSDFNNALDTMLNAAGPMAITHTPPCDTMPADLKRNLNFGWISSPMLRADVQTILDTIKNNFRPHAECWVQNNNYVNSYDGWLVFPSDSLILNSNDYTNYADEWHRLLEVFAHWNIINYFNPYKYNHNEPWDTTLYHNVVAIDTAHSDEQFYYAFKKITAQNDDAHTEGGTWDGYCNLPGGLYAWYSPLLILKYIPNQYVVIKSGIAGITPGDAIVSVNGLTTKQWEDSLRPYISAGDTAAFRRTVSSYMLNGNNGANCTIVYLDSLNNTHTLVATCSEYIYSNWLSLYDYVNGYFANDTLGSATYKLWSNCNIGYVNMGELQTTDVPNMYNALQNTDAIIFDMRDYPNGTAWPIANDMYPNQIAFSLFSTPDVTYPGTFFWQYDYLGANGNLTAYKGNVILLFNEVTQSQAEFSCMILGAMPHVTKIGSQTAGTDGNVTYYRLSQYMQTMFTTLGTYYANGDSTERVGIIPDDVVFPTRQGIYHHRDEVLEKALQVVSCPLAIPDINNPKAGISIYPNPGNGIFNLEIRNYELGMNTNIEVYNMLGEQVYSQFLPASSGTQFLIDLSSQPNGIYLYRVLAQDGSLVGQGKLVIQK